MRLVRLFLLFVLSLSLPLVGLAATGTTGGCLMMDSSMTSNGPALSAPMPKMEGCTQQQDASGKTKGQMDCKIGAECKVGGVYHPAAVPSLSTPQPFSQTVLMSADQVVISHSPNGVWRPPPSL
ncbi:hypothetical protein OL229_01270 [Neisseriaceae bacterium JH1-16]|nr:hypothetical protein [Neisseriaceae bacterium JH1-16]